MIEKYVRLVDELRRKTKERAVSWETTDAEGQYALKLKKGAILLDYTKRMLGTEYTITIVNKEGTPVDRIEVGLENSYYAHVDDLYEIIDRQVNRIDEQVDEIISEIEEL